MAIPLPDMQYKTTVLGALHMWCIRKVIGRRKVIMNVDLRIGRHLGLVLNTNHVYIHNCQLPSGLEIRSRA